MRYCHIHHRALQGGEICKDCFSEGALREFNRVPTTKLEFNKKELEQMIRWYEYAHTDAPSL